MHHREVQFTHADDDDDDDDHVVVVRAVVVVTRLAGGDLIAIANIGGCLAGYKQPAIG